MCGPEALVCMSNTQGCEEWVDTIREVEADHCRPGVLPLPCMSKIQGLGVE